MPRDAKAPTLARWNNDNNEPVVTLALLSPTRSPRELSILGENEVGKRLQRVDGVARVEINGLTEREVRIDLDPLRLRAYGVTPAQIAAALREANADQPVGLLSDGMQDTLLRVEGRVRDPKAVRRRGGGAPQRPGVAAGRPGAARSNASANPTRMARVNGQRAINFNVFKQQDANIVATGDAVKKAMDEVRKRLPPDVELRLINASSDWVKGSLDGLRSTLIEGALLTIAIVFLFLHSWRSTIITGLTLPIAVISSFIAVYAFGFTLNFMTMMALSLCIGLLIDDAIVVRENIVRHVHMGKDHLTAAREGTQEIGLAVMATTFAIVAVFAPVAFMGGIIGKFFYPFGITVVVAVLVSLFVSFTLDPMLSLGVEGPAVGAAEDAARHRPRHPRAPTALMDVLHAVYGRAIRWIFSDRRWRIGLPAYGHGFGADGRRDKASPRRWRSATLTPRGVVMAVGTGSFLAALALAPLVGSEFVPETDQNFTQLALKHAGGQQPGAHRRQGGAGRGHRAGHARGQARVSTWIGGAGPAQPGLAEHRAGGPQGTPALAEAGGRRDARSHRQGARHRCQRRLQPAHLRGHPGQRPRGPGAAGRRVRREGEEDPRRGGRGNRRCRPACRPMRCA